MTRWIRGGVAIEELLRGLRVALDEGVTLSDEVVDDLGLDPRVRQVMVQRILAWSDLAMTTAVERFHAAPVPPRLQRFAGLLAALNRGVPPGRDWLAELAAAGIEHGSTYSAVIVRPIGGSAFPLADLMGTRGGIIAFVEGEYLALLPVAPAALVGAIAGIGPSLPPADAPRSFLLAQRALRTAVASGLSGPHRFDDLGILPAVIDDDAVSDALFRLYVAPCLRVPHGAELLDTVETLLSDPSRARAAASLLIHENTLRNRVARFEELTGCDLRRARDVAEVWWALRVRDTRRVRAE